MLRRRTATLTATTPTSRTASSPIQTTPPASRRRGAADARRGLGRACGTAVASTCAAEVQLAMSGLDGPAQACRRGTRVVGDLLGGRADGPLRERAQLGFLPADTDREVRRAGAS